MVSVDDAEKIVLSQVKDFGTTLVPFEQALGCVLSENLYADRNLPSFNRVTMDGIAINYERYEKGIRSFPIIATQAAGERPFDITDSVTCVEIMTGAALSETLNTVVRYEDITIENGIATINTQDIKKGQNIHSEGSDKKQGDVVVFGNQIINPAIIGIAASIGKTELLVKQLPKVVIISTGDELTEVSEAPSPYQIRKSNNYTIKAVLQKYGIQPQMYHFVDSLESTKTKLSQCLKDFDAVIISGGISMGKFDFIPLALSELNVELLFHKINQRPGKPFWFGAHNNSTLVFAFPGNPVSTFLCLHRYFIPWLEATLSISKPVSYAMLGADVYFKQNMQYFIQVNVAANSIGQLIALPLEGNGSGDFSNLVATNAFIELPAQQQYFEKGTVYKVWYF